MAKICKEGTDNIGSALKKLERAGYIVRNRLRDSKGKIMEVEYVTYETPHPPATIDSYYESLVNHDLYGNVEQKGNDRSCRKKISSAPLPSA